MAEQELDRAASDTITERAVEALANARLSSQIPEFSGDEPSSTALIRVLMNFVQCALHVLRFGDHVSIEPNPVMHQYMRTMLERTPNSMFYIAFDSTAQSREPWDLSARSNAIDVITYLCVGQNEEEVRKWGIYTLSERTIEEYAGVIAAAAATRLDDDDITVQIVALETLSRLPPASLAIHSDAIAACLSLEEEEVQWAALEALSKLTPVVLLRHKDALASLHDDSPPDEMTTLVKERYPDEPTLADVKARARKMHDALYEPGAPGYEAAKASFEALALYP